MKDKYIFISVEKGIGMLEGQMQTCVHCCRYLFLKENDNDMMCPVCKGVREEGDACKSARRFIYAAQNKDEVPFPEEITDEDVEAALVVFSGAKTKAAKFLGVSIMALSFKIADTPRLELFLDGVLKKENREKMNIYKNQYKDRARAYRERFAENLKGKK